MRTRLLAILISLMACVLLALGLPLAASQAAAEQQHLVVDRIDDTARFSGAAQNAIGALTAARDGRTEPAAKPAAKPEGPAAGTDAAAADAAAEAAAEPGRRRMLIGELERYHEVYGIRVGVFDRDGKPLVAAPAGYRLSDNPAAELAFAEALDGRRSHDPPQVWPWQESRLQVASPVVRDGDVVAVMLTDSPTGELRSRILDRWLIIAAGEFAAVLVAVLLAFRLTNWVLRPVRVLDRAAHDIATGRMAARVAPAGGPPELRRLAESFNEMAGNVEAAVEQQRAFVADASHQLRNPLQALTLRIELLGAVLPPEQEEDLDGVRGESARLRRVLDDLLGLAQAEHARPELRLTDVGALVRERVAAWRPYAEQSGVLLRTEGPEAATAWVDAIGLGSALDAVLDNAVQFTPDGEEVIAGLRVRGDTVEIAVADSGPGLDPEELQRIGDRFWRSPRHQKREGSGLGLSIARTLLANAEAELAFTPGGAGAEDGGLTVSVRLPRTNPAER